MKLVQILLRIEANDLISIIRIGKVVMRIGHKNGHIKSTKGEIAHTRRVTVATGTEAPIIRIFRRIGKDALSAGESVGRNAIVDYLAGEIEGQRPANVRQVQRNGRPVPARCPAFTKRSVDHPTIRFVISKVKITEL